MPHPLRLQRVIRHESSRAMSTRLFLIAHAPLASALHACAQHVFPECAHHVMALDVPPDEPPTHTLERVQRLLESDHTDGAIPPPTLVLSDVLGATPCNIAQRLLDAHPQYRLVTGVNLPMLLRTICYRHETVDTLVQRAVDGATAGVISLSSSAAVPPAPGCACHTCPNSGQTP